MEHKDEEKRVKEEKKSEVDCSNGHPLIKVAANSQWGCDICHKSVAYGCPKCNYYLCNVHHAGKLDEILSGLFNKRNTQV